MSDNRNYIVSLCEQLQSNQQQPTVALIRKTANHPLPLPEVISVLRRWKTDPNQFPAQPKQQEETAAKVKTAEQRLLDLEAQVASLEAQVTHLTDLVSGLSTKA